MVYNITYNSLQGNPVSILDQLLVAESVDDYTEI